MVITSFTGRIVTDVKHSVRARWGKSFSRFLVQEDAPSKLFYCVQTTSKHYIAILNRAGETGQKIHVVVSLRPTTTGNTPNPVSYYLLVVDVCILAE